MTRELDRNAQPGPGPAIRVVISPPGDSDAHKFVRDKRKRNSQKASK